VPVTHSKEQLVLAGQYGTLKDLRVTLLTVKNVQDAQADLIGDVSASYFDEQGNRDFEEVYKKVSFVVTGQRE
jgi:hypothetical protein